MEGAFKIAQSLNGDWSFRVLDNIVKAQVETGDLKGAIETTNSMESPTYKVSGFQRIARSQLKAGDKVGALRTVEQALQTANTMADPLQKDGALAETAKIQATAGDVEGALRTASRINDPYIKFTFALDGIARMQLLAGDKVGALMTLQQALVTAKAINSPIELQLRTIAVAQAQAGDIKAALQTANSIADTDSRAATLRAIASAQVGSGDVKGARTWALGEKVSFVKAYALLGVAEGILGLKPWEEKFVLQK